MGNTQKNSAKNSKSSTNLVKIIDSKNPFKKTMFDFKKFSWRIFRANTETKNEKEETSDHDEYLKKRNNQNNNFIKIRKKEIIVNANETNSKLGGDNINPSSGDDKIKNENVDYNHENINEENEEEENDEESEIDEIDITNNIKKVFIYSKRIKYIKTNNTDEPKSAISTFDYELNFFRDGDALRGSYMSKLIQTNIWNPDMKPQQHNSLIIFDWDDTLLPTSYLVSDCSLQGDIELSRPEMEKMKQIEQNVGSILKESIEKGKAYIITNAGINWVKYTAKRFYRNIINLLNRIEIISARSEYEKLFPDNTRQWKIQAFLDIVKDVDIKKVTNIICIGDSLLEIEAGRILASKFNKAFIKTIKFRDTPKLDELLKQLKLVSQKFGSIYSSIKNLTIRIEKKKNEI